MTHIIYLYHTLEFINLKQPIYKIGKSTQSDCKRFKGYKKGGRLLYLSECYDCHELERQLIELFKTKYELKQGKEYFKGNFRRMVNDIQFACYNEQGDVALDDVISNENQIMQQNIEVTLKNIEVMQQVMQQNIELETAQRRIENDSIIQAVVEEEWIHQCFIEEGVPDAVVEEWIYQYFTEELEENIPDIVVEEIDIIIEDIEEDNIENERIHAYVENEFTRRGIVVEDTEDENILSGKDEDEDEDEDENDTTDDNHNLRNKRFSCKTCNYSTNVKSNLQKHFLTKKYLLELCPEVVDPTIPQKHKCNICDKCYKSQSGLWKHSQVCKAPLVPEVPIAPEIVDMDLQTKIDNLERVIGKLTSLVENNLTIASK